MEVADEVLGVGEVFRRFPSPLGDRPVFPVNEVLELATASARIQNFLGLEFLVVVDDNGRRRILHSAGNVVRAKRLEEADMEHGMDPHGAWELELVGGIADLGLDGERPEALGVEFVAGTGRLDVAPQKPNLIAFLERWSPLDLAVVEARLSGSGIGKIPSDLVVEVPEGLDQLFGCWVGRLESVSVDGGRQRGVVAVVGEER